jgi:hypothetical protein
MRQSNAFIVILVWMGSGIAAGQSNIDPERKHAWSESAGWTNWRDANDSSQGVVVSDTFLSGHVWGENEGWIDVGAGPSNGESYLNVNGSDFGVNVDAQGNLSGFGWAENSGWVVFETSSLGANQARIDLTVSPRRFRGYAWGENSGWFNLDDEIHFVAIETDIVIPTVSEWGIAVMVLLIFTAGTIVFGQQRRVPA